jgi:hypothetical protein
MSNTYDNITCTTCGSDASFTYTGTVPTPPLIQPYEPAGPYNTLESIEKSVQGVHATCAAGFHVMAKNMDALHKNIEILNFTIIELLAKIKELCR